MARKSLTVDDVLKAVSQWPPLKRQELLVELSRSEFTTGTGYVVVASNLLKKVRAKLEDVPKELEKAAKVTIKLATKLYEGRRKHDEERLRRGELIDEAHESGTSWKAMPGWVVKHHPEWFPEHEGKVPSGEEKTKFAERLRRMARDTRKQRN